MGATPSPDAARAEALLGELVAARSPNPPGDERAVAAVIVEQARALGLPPATLHGRTPERPNLILTIGEGSPNLLVAGHMDTMPPGDLGAWQTDPYRLERVGDRLVGLGATDMKASLAVMLLAAERIASEAPPAGSLTLVFSADEERGSAYGMQWLAAAGLLSADAAVMAEPSSLRGASFERLFVAQRGSCAVWLTAHGAPGHSAADVPRERRASAAFARALTALLASDPFAELRHPVDGTRPTVNVGTMVEGGMVPFAHPPSLRAMIDVRTIDGMTVQSVLAGLQSVIDGAGLAGRVSLDLGEPPIDWIAAGETVGDGPLRRAAAGAWRDVLGRDPELGVLPAASDSSHLDALGIPTLPTFGPGSLDVAHQPNESIAAADLVPAIDLLEALIRRFLSDPAA
jgi:acetylornithine deacetylase/succinyl-diaminopimelate desuccinylase-like protein